MLGGPHVAGYVAFCVSTIVFIVSIRVRTSKRVTPHDTNFGKVLERLQEGFGDVERESECAIERDRNGECAEAE